MTEGDRHDVTTCDRVTAGVFFTPPAALPRGRHNLTRVQVERAQHERAMIAATELLACTGYRGVGVAEICARATLSRAAFYEQFADKDACIFAAYDRFISVLVNKLATIGAGGTSPEAVTSGVIGGYLGALEADPVVARAFQVEMDALGRDARKRRRDALVALAELLSSLLQSLAPVAPISAFVSAVYGVRQIASDALDEQVRPDLLAMVPELTSSVVRAVVTAP